ncbi:hypothetical protein QZH41_009230, partial [Actinostola sp. cb2023]
SKTPAKTPRKTPKRPPGNKLKDPVEVYCRVKPLGENDEESCVRIIDEDKKLLQLTAPKFSQAFKSGHRIETQHTFKHVYDTDTKQKELFDQLAFPLVEDLLHGKNGLIFAYGITGSGKTHTMTGIPSNSGLLPRCLDVIFNSIIELQTESCVFKPDRNNGWEIQTEQNANLDREIKEKEAVLKAPPQTPKRNGNIDTDYSDMVRIPETAKIDQENMDFDEKSLTLLLHGLLQGWGVIHVITKLGSSSHFIAQQLISHGYCQSVLPSHGYCQSVLPSHGYCQSVLPSHGYCQSVLPSHGYCQFVLPSHGYCQSVLPSHGYCQSVLPSHGYCQSVLPSHGYCQSVLPSHGYQAMDYCQSVLPSHGYCQSVLPSHGYCQSVLPSHGYCQSVLPSHGYCQSVLPSHGYCQFVLPSHGYCQSVLPSHGYCQSVLPSHGYCQSVLPSHGYCQSVLPSHGYCQSVLPSHGYCQSVLPSHGYCQSVLPSHGYCQSVLPSHGYCQSVLPSHGYCQSVLPSHGYCQSVLPSHGYCQSVLPSHGYCQSVLPSHGYCQSVLPSHGYCQSVLPSHAYCQSVLPSHGYCQSVLPSHGYYQSVLLSHGYCQSVLPSHGYCQSVLPSHGYCQSVLPSHGYCQSATKPRLLQLFDLLFTVSIYLPVQNVHLTPLKEDYKVDEDNGYSVFVSYIEIYNNFIYDLLEDVEIDPICPKPPASKTLREDYDKNMFVSGATEVEVKSTEQAYTVFWRGQKRRHVGQTILNQESSRSHSVFAIKLVQAPLDPDGEDVLQDSSQIAVSTLSLCDLAGSERSKRTNTGGERLKEAGNINNSLMTLRTCIEILRENQSSYENGQQTRIVPYRDCKLTHLFKNFFDGEGKVRMVVCLNPSAEEYDESIHVMKFAELTQEVVVARQSAIKFETGLTPGRRKVHQMFREALAQIDTDEGGNKEDTVIISKPIHTMGPPFPLTLLTSAEDSHTLLKLMEYLQARQRRRHTLVDDLARKQGIFRAQLLEFEKQNSGANNALMSMKNTVEEKDREIQRLERRLKAALHKNEMLHKTATIYEYDKRELQDELLDLKKKAEREKQDKLKLKTALKGVVSQEKDKWERECNKRVKSKEEEMQAKVWQREEKLRQLKDIVQNMKYDRPTTRSQIKSGNNQARSKSPPPVARKPQIKARHRRSKSTDCWIEHKPPCNLDTDTVMQPVFRNKKTVAKPEGRHLANGNVYETIAGGASVLFTGVETLRTRQELQLSPDRFKTQSLR